MRSAKSFMLYVDIAYEYSKGNEATAWQAEPRRKAGTEWSRFKFAVV